MKLFALNSSPGTPVSSLIKVDSQPIAYIHLCLVMQVTEDGQDLSPDVDLPNYSY